MLLSNKLFKQNSIYSKIVMMTITSIALSSIFLTTYLIYNNVQENRTFRKSVILEQVKQTLSLTEDQLIASDYKIVTKAINNIAAIEEVVLLDKNCNGLANIPLNANHSKLCKNNQINDHYIFYPIKNSFSDAHFISVKTFPLVYGKQGVQLIGLIFFVIVFSIASAGLLIISLKKYFEGPFSQITSFIQNISPNSNSNDAVVKNLPIELTPIKETLLKTKKELIDSQNKIIEQERKQAVAEMCLQIAHDIRSPLPIIEQFAENTSSDYSEKDQELLKMASKRISDIAENLLRKKDGLLGLEEEREEKEHVKLSKLISNVVKEKQVANSNVSILLIEKESDIEYTLPSKSFTRVLSNLIQNSIESIHDKGEITLTLRESHDTIILTIKDNGIGIKPEDMIHIKKKGTSIGKENGTGLGLSHANEMIGSLGGELLIESIFQKGTEVKILLPRINKLLSKETHYVLIDDDEITHFNWKQSAKKNEINLSTFFSPQEFYKKCGDFSKRTVVCIDSNLGTNIKGEEEAERIHNLGFANINLITGLDQKSLQGLPFIQNVHNKSPIWPLS